nr:MAG TPA: hypothetical protein [Caudoviricetes sp.]
MLSPKEQRYSSIDEMQNVRRSYMNKKCKN